MTGLLIYAALSAAAITITLRWGINNWRRREERELRSMTTGRLRANLEARARAQLAADQEPWGDVPNLPEDRSDV